MTLSPEAQILVLNAVIMGIAYFGIYPGLQIKSINRMLSVDLILTAIALTVAGALFMGTGTRFTLLFFQTNWAVFSFLTLMAIEAPLAMQFIKKYDIKLTDDDEP